MVIYVLIILESERDMLNVIISLHKNFSQRPIKSVSKNIYDFCYKRS